MECARCDHEENEHEGEYYKSCTAEDCICADFESKPLKKETVND